MILIASGAYVQGEFTSEVGLLPPSFLPVGNRRLYEYQVDFLKACCEDHSDFYLSVPASFDMDDYDVARLNQLNVNVLFVPDELSLGDSLLYSWNATAKHHDHLVLLHGDTLFLNAYFGEQDALSVHTNHGFYKRASLGKEMIAIEQIRNNWSNDCEQVVSGFFHFSKPLFFMKSLVESRGDFIQAIAMYNQACPLNILSRGDWLDFGHVNSFYLSRTKMTTQRSFNELKIGLRSVYKSSSNNSKKIFAEGNWFATLPLPLRLYTPALLSLDKGEESFKKAYYELEYLYLLPLNDLLVFGRLSESYWLTIFNSISKMLDEFDRFRPSAVSNDQLKQLDGIYLSKTISRLSEYAGQQGKSLDEMVFSLGDGFNIGLDEIAKECAGLIAPIRSDGIAVSHGDLCFSNILFDSRVEAIKCIDPRGMSQQGELSIFGDKRYDVAKLYHSIVGLYDFIIAGRFTIDIEPDHRLKLEIFCDEIFLRKIEDIFRKTIIEKMGYDEKEILAITVLLFLSMLPLHSDRPERQQAFIANALRLFKKLKYEK